MKTLEPLVAEEDQTDLESMAFSEVLYKRRSVRKYLEKPVEINLLKRIIQESTLAPVSKIY